MTLPLLLLAMTGAILTCAGLYLALLHPRICCVGCGYPLDAAPWQRDGRLDRVRCPCCDALSSWQGGRLVSYRAPAEQGTRGAVLRVRDEVER